jgi:hypothetical protein
MTRSKIKGKIIGQILEKTHKTGSLIYFDKLVEKSESYLKRLVKVVEKLAK